MAERRPLISEAYVSMVGNLVVFISQPVLGADGSYLGYIGGSIYLKQRNELNALLGEHYYHDGSYLYVVDRSRRLLYHPDPERVGQAHHPADNHGKRQRTNQVGGNNKGYRGHGGFTTMRSFGFYGILTVPRNRHIESAWTSFSCAKCASTP